jgi:hypothetical protein
MIHPTVLRRLASALAISPQRRASIDNDLTASSLSTEGVPHESMMTRT